MRSYTALCTLMLLTSAAGHGQGSEQYEKCLRKSPYISPEVRKAECARGPERIRTVPEILAENDKQLAAENAQARQNLGNFYAALGADQERRARQWRPDEEVEIIEDDVPEYHRNYAPPAAYEEIAPAPAPVPDAPIVGSDVVPPPLPQPRGPAADAPIVAAPIAPPPMPQPKGAIPDASIVAAPIAPPPMPGSNAPIVGSNVVPPPMPQPNAPIVAAPIAPPPMPGSNAPIVGSNVVPPPMPQPNAPIVAAPIAPPPMPGSNAPIVGSNVVPPPMPQPNAPIVAAPIAHPPAPDANPPVMPPFANVIRELRHKKPQKPSDLTSQPVASLPQNPATATSSTASKVGPAPLPPQSPFKPDTSIKNEGLKPTVGPLAEDHGQLAPPPPYNRKVVTPAPARLAKETVAPEAAPQLPNVQPTPAAPPIARERESKKPKEIPQKPLSPAQDRAKETVAPEVPPQLPVQPTPSTPAIAREKSNVIPKEIPQKPLSPAQDRAKETVAPEVPPQLPVQPTPSAPAIAREKTSVIPKEIPQKPLSPAQKRVDETVAPEAAPQIPVQPTPSTPAIAREKTSVIPKEIPQKPLSPAQNRAEETVAPEAVPRPSTPAIAREKIVTEPKEKPVLEVAPPRSAKAREEDARRIEAEKAAALAKEQDEAAEKNEKASAQADEAAEAARRVREANAKAKALQNQEAARNAKIKTGANQLNVAGAIPLSPAQQFLKNQNIEGSTPPATATPSGKIDTTLNKSTKLPTEQPSAGTVQSKPNRGSVSWRDPDENADEGLRNAITERGTSSPSAATPPPPPVGQVSSDTTQKQNLSPRGSLNLPRGGALDIPITEDAPQSQQPESGARPVQSSQSESKPGFFGKVFDTVVDFFGTRTPEQMKFINEDNARKAKSREIDRRTTQLEGDRNPSSSSSSSSQPPAQELPIGRERTLPGADQPPAAQPQIPPSAVPTFPPGVISGVKKGVELLKKIP